MNLVLHLVSYFDVLMKQVLHIIVEKMLELAFAVVKVLINVFPHNIHNKILANQRVKH